MPRWSESSPGVYGEVLTQHRNGQNELATIEKVRRGEHEGALVLCFYDENSPTVAPMMLDVGTLDWLIRSIPHVQPHVNPGEAIRLLMLSHLAAIVKIKAEGIASDSERAEALMETVDNKLLALAGHPQLVANVMSGMLSMNMALISGLADLQHTDFAELVNLFAERVAKTGDDWMRDE